MAKTIKFNLILDDYTVRNLEDLQEHFSIDDIIKYFKNGLLERWLDVRGYDEQLEKIRKIDSKGTNKEIIIDLIKIFDIAINNEDVEKGIAILDYLIEAEKLNSSYKENAEKKHAIIKDYHLGYKSLIKNMEENKENMAILKADVLEMEKEYFGLFELDNSSLFYRLVNSAPKAIFALLTRDAFRKFWIGGEADKKIYKNIKSNLLHMDNIKKILGNDLIVVNKNTQQGWDTIKGPEVEVMVLKIEYGAFVRNCDNRFEKLSCDDVEYKLLKLKGLDYQCTDENSTLLYMEV